MASLNSYYCPKCGTAFPLFIRSSMRINRGLLAPFLKCPNCGQISRTKFDFIRAVWIWPINIGLFALLIYAPRYITYSGSGTDNLFRLMAFLYMFPFFLGLRSGMKLVEVDAASTLKQNKYRKWIVPLFLIILIDMIYGFYTHDWLNVVIGFIVGLIAWGFYYRLSRRNTSITN